MLTRVALFTIAVCLLSLIVFLQAKNVAQPTSSSTPLQSS
jgi:hypothetical protein